MKILVAGSFTTYDMYAKAFAEAFRRLGHEVYCFDTDRFEMNEDNPLKVAVGKVKRHWLIGPAITAASLELRKAVNRFHPDMVFLYHCYFINPHTVKAISRKAPVFSYDNDDPFEQRRNKPNSSFERAAARYCRLNYVYRRKNIDDYRQIGIENAKLLLPYYMETRNYPIACEKDIPLAFVGHWEDDGRDELLKTLLDAGLPLALYGEPKGWKQSRYWPQLQQCFHGPANGSKYNDLMNRIQVALVFFSKQNNDTYTRRSFELPVTKTVMLSEYTADMDSFWPEDECCVYFRDREELVQKAKWLLDNPEQMQTIADNAFNRLKALGCSETDRVREILADYEAVVRGNNPR
ncbi:MAG: glycosyltransferase [Bacteroidales bacterium]|nr:glycosyltransferase [Bacteroidales bacterium]